jgi:capsular polysaccharide export protein
MSAVADKPPVDGESLKSRHFLLLQMPCGRFGRQLQQSFRRAGHRCSRVAINGGDLMSTLRGSAIAYTRAFADWPAWVANFVQQNGVTDLVC